MEQLKGQLQESFDVAVGRGGSIGVPSFNLHDALVERAGAHVPEEWAENPAGYERSFVESGKAHMQAQEDMHWQEGKAFTVEDQKRMIENLPADLDAMQIETHYLNRDLRPETLERRHVINNTVSELSVAAQYEDMGGPAAFADPALVQTQTDNILDRAAMNAQKYDFEAEQAYTDMTGTVLPMGAATQLERNMAAPEVQVIAHDMSLAENTM